MRIHWKSLFGYGFTFWAILCLSDLLGFTKISSYNLDELYNQPFERSWEDLKPIETSPSFSNNNQKQEYRGLKFGWALLVLNSLTFIFSIIVCSFVRAVTWTIYKLFKPRRQIYEIKAPTNLERQSSKIPIMIKSPSLTIRASETDLDAKQYITSEKSCPNLLRRNNSNLSAKTTGNCEMLFKNDNLFSVALNGTSKDVDVRCKKLKEELVRIQTTSLKEHAMLSRKLECVIKEKRDVSKQLAIAQKENRAAKQQLEEMLQEKTSLTRRLESATKEFKCNTKTKKFALAKLEEVTENVEQLSLQLEQVTRDKEILQKKLKLLENEYSKLHERYLNKQNQHGNSPSDNMPERDSVDEKERVDTCRKGSSSSETGELISNNIPNTAASLLASVSQTELDMKNIQMKIKQLEKNLENFGVGNITNNFSKNVEEVDQTTECNTTDGSFSNKITEDGEYQSECYSDNNSPRSKYWVAKSAEIFGKHEQYARIQALANKMHKKVQNLGKIREHSEDTVAEESSEIEDLSSHSDVREPTRIVSNSIPFKNFLKGLYHVESSRRNNLGEFY